jgi:hypothetical protein
VAGYGKGILILHCESWSVESTRGQCITVEFGTAKRHDLSRGEVAKGNETELPISVAPYLSPCYKSRRMLTRGAICVGFIQDQALLFR